MITINAALLLLILIVVYMKTHKANVSLNYKYNSIDQKVIDLIAKSFSENVDDHKLQLIAVFNQLPTLSELEIINKLYYKFNDTFNIRGLFTKKFKANFPVIFEHRFLPNNKINCQKDNEIVESKFYLILIGKRTVFFEDNFDLREMMLVMQNVLFPEKTYDDFTMSISELKKKIKVRLEKSPIALLNLEKNMLEDVRYSTTMPEIKFFHSDCSACVLKSILQRIKVKEILNQKDEVIIFSALSDSILLKKLVIEKNIRSRVYVDLKDEFDLLTVITEDMEKPIIIEKNIQEEI